MGCRSGVILVGAGTAFALTRHQMMEAPQQLTRLAECDSKLRERRTQRSELVHRLDRQRTTIASQATMGGRRKPGIRFTELIPEYERALKVAAPQLAELNKDIQQLERERGKLLADLSPELRTAYEERLQSSS